MATLVQGNGELVSVDRVYGAMYWGFVLSTSFVGISLVQGYLYFTRNSNDPRSTKALVISLLILDPVISLLTANVIYYYFVVNFGVAEVFGEVLISWIIENGLTVFVTAMVQVFFASRVYLVNKSIDVLPLGRTAPALVFVFAFVAFAAGIVRIILLSLLRVSWAPQKRIQTVRIVEESSALLSDILSSACLCYMLAPLRFSSMNRPETLKAMFMFTINRAILMTLIQIGMLSAYLSVKYYMYWVPFYFCKSKLYTNTLLAMLNSRSGGSFQPQITSQPPWDTPIIDLTVKESGGIIAQSMSTAECDVENVATLKEDAGRPNNSLPNLTSPESIVGISDSNSTWITRGSGRSSSSHTGRLC